MSINNLTQDRLKRLYEEYWVSVILGSKQRYDVLVKLLKDYREGYMSPEGYNDLVKRVNTQTSEMCWRLGRGFILTRLIRNPFIVRKYRQKLRKDEVVAPHLKTLEAYLKLNL